MGMERLSGYDAFFLELESSTQPVNVCCLLEVDTHTMPGGYTFDRFADALAVRIDAVPEFRMKLADSQLNLAYPVWVEEQDFRLDRHLNRACLPRPGGRAELAEVCAHIAALPLDRAHPLWEMWVIESPDDSDALAVMLKSHHAALDGVAGADLMFQLCSLDVDAPAPAPVDGPGAANRIEIAASGFVDLLRRPQRMADVDSRHRDDRRAHRAARNQWAGHGASVRGAVNGLQRTVHEPSKYRVHPGRPGGRQEGQGPVRHHRQRRRDGNVLRSIAAVPARPRRNARRSP